MFSTTISIFSYFTHQYLFMFNKYPLPSSLMHHPSLSKWLDSNIYSFHFKSFFFSPKSRKYRAYSYLIHTFTNTSMITKTFLLHHLFYDVHIKSFKPHLNKYKNSHSLSSLMSDIHPHTIKHTRPTPIIHHMLSIHIHKSMYHIP